MSLKTIVGKDGYALSDLQTHKESMSNVIESSSSDCMIRQLVSTITTISLNQ